MSTTGKKIDSLKQDGFTLLELSVVLVVIGLLAGGLVLASGMTRTAQIQQTLAQYDRYVKAIKEFQDKYQALPGDMPNATGFWGSADGSVPSTATCYTHLPSGTKTCDGNGDGRMGSICTLASCVKQPYETYFVWQHLLNAGFIEGAFIGAYSSTGNVNLGTNVPAAKIKGAGWYINYWLLKSGERGWVGQGPMGTHVLGLEGITPIVLPNAGTFYLPASGYGLPVLTSSEAQAIDQKLDDGMPYTGNIRGFGTIVSEGGTTCINVPTATGTYVTNAPNEGFAIGKPNQGGCWLFFLLNF